MTNMTNPNIKFRFFNMFIYKGNLYKTIKAEEVWLKKVVEENQIDEVIQDGIKDLNQIEDEGDKQIYDMVANCIEREAKEASMTIEK